ncbi:MAG TPA: multicopper oxidase domain-containing protein [Gemmatimonadales bacterium]|nr:multicopper oxidase domain-containing protein [Gemmatimonadales bacterium]
MRLIRAGALLGLMAVASGCAPRPPAHARIEANRNRVAGGMFDGGRLSITLEARRGEWFPNGPTGTSISVLAFGEEGKSLQNPGPLIRVPAGTTVSATLRNSTGSALVMHGLYSRPTTTADSLVIAPRGEQKVEFRLDAPGTWYYWGSTNRQAIDDRDGDDSQLSGAIVVDSAGATPGADRVFVLGVWSRPPDYPRPGIDSLQEIMVINGEAWPNTERLEFNQGDSVRWRWINPSASSHPMHLHGFYFQLTSRGDESRDTVFDAAHRFQEVTELIQPGGTATLRWSPDRAGNWLFHCHFSFHVSPEASLPGADAHEASMPGMATRRPGAAHWHHGMGGLILGLTVHPRPGTAPPAPPTSARRIRLLVQSKPRQFGSAPGYGYVVQSGNRPPAADSISIPGTPLVLTRGEPVRVTIVNHLTDITSVHWHGIELESAPDGVPGWSGIPPSVTPPIQPGDSFVAAFTPPRAGTFIYHNHLNELEQQHLGLYGPLIVLAPGTKWNPDTDHIVLVSPSGESTDTTKGLVNGSRTPASIRVRRGVVQRFRLINIHGDYRIRFALERGGSVSRWRPVAKDGADLPPALADWRRAELVTGPGETEDVEIGPEPKGELMLRISAPFAEPVWEIPLRIVVE